MARTTTADHICQGRLTCIYIEHPREQRGSVSNMCERFDLPSKRGWFPRDPTNQSYKFP